MGEAELRRCAEKGVSYSDTRYAGSSCGFGHGLGHRRADALVKCLGDDVIRAQLVLGHKPRNRVARRNLHRLVDVLGAAIERAHWNDNLRRSSADDDSSASVPKHN